MGINIRSRPGKPQTNSNEENHEGSPLASANEEESSNSMNPLSASGKDLE